MAPVSREKTLHCFFGKESYNKCRTKLTAWDIFKLVALVICGIGVVGLWGLILYSELKDYMRSWKFLSFKRSKQEPTPSSETCTPQNLDDCTEPSLNVSTDSDCVPLKSPTLAYSSHLPSDRSASPVPSYRSASPVPAYTKEIA